ncbi:restriction endonuclease [Bacteriovorax sp. BSW11_IV]|uniref:restriction endonuclease n=1 Tax=Bacteriovorax sp. BSW11_IV TaxID=1353529 RepID=UPI00038A1231|nr:restriction endonuclease [Bacteriovorax sp. BSW11_IV]EQC46411.1 restriction endonuclease [Bacteriovorax sp. BSW11_IV]
MTKRKAPRNLWLQKRQKHFEKFDPKKLKRSLELSGAPKHVCDDVYGSLEDRLENNFTTKKLHNMAYRLLHKKSKIAAANYHIKRGVEELGPTGFPFEMLCAELLRMKGFDVKVGVIVEGEFVKHEVDVIGVRPDLTVMAECKYHNSRAHKNDIKTALYIYARSLDIKNNVHSLNFDKYMIITNTYFSKDAIAYAEGVGLILISMNHPHEFNLIESISKYRTYPVTCLRSLKKSIARDLIHRKIIVIRQLKKRKRVLAEYGLDKSEIKVVIDEINQLLA